MYFRETGLPNPAKVVVADGSMPELITSKGREEIVVYDILTNQALELTDQTNTIIHVQAGNCNLSSPVRFGRGNNVALIVSGGTGNVTVTYDIVRPPIDS
jgi:hypothetical protein